MAKKNKLTIKEVESAKKKLLKKNVKDGKIEQRDIFKLIPDVPENIDILEKFYLELDKDEIELIEATEPNVEDFTDEWEVEEEKKKDKKDKKDKVVSDVKKENELKKDKKDKKK